MEAFTIAGKVDEITVTSTYGSTESGIIFRIGNAPDAEGWHHVPHRVHYLCRGHVLTVTGGGYVKPTGGWDTRSEAETTAGIVASVIWRTVQAVEGYMNSIGAQPLHTYHSVHAEVVRALAQQAHP